MSKRSVARLALALVAFLGVIAHGVVTAAPVAAPCTSYSIDPTSVSPGPTAGSQDVTITGSPAGCTGTLTATANDTWLSVSATSGSGSGSVTISWPQNPLPASRTATVTIAGNTFTVTQGAAALPAGTYFSDNLEGGGTNWVYQVPWALTTEIALSGTHSLSDSPGGNYGSNVNATVFSVPIDLTSAHVPQLRFWQRLDFPADGQDSGNVWVSRDDLSPLEFLQRYWGTTPGWTETVLDLTPYAGLSSVRIYFQVLTNGAGSADGWHIDDVLVKEAPLAANSKNDFNRDGFMDLLFQHLTTGDLAVWLMNGPTRTSGVTPTPWHVNTNWHMVGTGDFNADGKPDILWQEQNAGDLVVWFMDGVTRTSYSYLSIARPADPGWKVAAVADLNGDTKPDLVWQHATNGQLAAWMLNGTNVTLRVSLNPWVVVDNNWKIVNSGDFNGDGKADLVWKHSTEGYLVVWMMSGVNRTSVEWLSPFKLIDAAWEVVAAGDLNGDHKVDLVFQHPTDGRLVAWYMDGVSRIGAQMLTPDHVLDANWRIVAPR